MIKNSKKNTARMCVKLFLLFIPLLSIAGPKTDTVYLFNGDRITGEIKRFEYGMLVLKTDGLGTLKIEFDRIKTFYSKEQFTVQLSSGLRFFGAIDTSGTPGYVNLKVESFTILEPISAIVEIYPLKRAFWKRLDGSIDLGYSYTKASTVSQLNFSTDIDYRVKKSYTQLSGDLIFTDQQDRDRIRKQDYTFVFNRFFRKTVFASAFIGGQQNTELGTELRLYGGLGIGNDFVHNNLHVLNGALGALLSTEISQDDSTINSVEAVMHWNYKIFRFNDPEIDVTSHFNVYPSLTTLGRVRLEFQVKAMIEIFNDFFFGLTFWDNYDSEPLDPTATQNDWGINTSIGYSW